MKVDLAWQSLHAAAAAACRGSTPSGGGGPWANVVIAKLNTHSCDALCGETSYTQCDADISILGKGISDTSTTDTSTTYRRHKYHSVILN